MVHSRRTPPNDRNNPLRIEVSVPRLTTDEGLAPDRPELLGERYEARLDRDARRRGGAFYTPSALAAELVAATLGPLLDAGQDPGSISVYDPAVGGGALLLAAARFLIDGGGDPRSVAGHLAGVDVDAGAVAVAVASITLLTGAVPSGVVVGDALAGAPGRFDAVVANPPFLGQLKRATARSREQAAVAEGRFGRAAAGYADTAGLFLLRCIELTRPGGRVGIILPAPMVTARDAAALRRRVGASSRVERLWSPARSDFDAGVRVIAAVVDVSPSPDGPWARGEWSLLRARDAHDPPAVELRSDGVVGDRATATADFRDQFYGVAAVAVDEQTVAEHTGDRDRPRLVTCGLIDPALLRWGRGPARLARRAFAHPRAELSALDPRLGAWAAGRLVPKLLVATQTRILEAVADPAGDLLPVVPVISVVAPPESLWPLLAAVLAPPVAAHARRLHAGAALSADAIKLSARQVAALPLPVDHAAWDEGARAAREATEAGAAGDGDAWRAALDRLGVVMCAAYDVPASGLLGWWAERLERIHRP